MRVNTSIGATTQRAVRSDWASASRLGASSPNTMSRAVMRMNVIVTAIVCEAAVPAQSPARSCSGGWSRLASAGSPTQPRPRLDMVTPSCVAAMDVSSFFSEPSSRRARAWPALARCSMRVRRTATKANSVATNSPFVATSASTASRPMMIVTSEDTEDPLALHGTSSAVGRSVPRASARPGAGPGWSSGPRRGWRGAGPGARRRGWGRARRGRDASRASRR